MRTSEQTQELDKALALAQAEFPKVVRDSENPYFKSRYADLATLINATQDVLGKHGLAIRQHLETETMTYVDPDGTVKGEKLVLSIITRLSHSSGQFEESALKIPLMDAKPQTLGSASTYGRRYALQSVMRVAGEDDDGNAASLNENWSQKQKDDYVKDKTAGLKKDIKQQKQQLKQQLQDSVDEIKSKPPDQPKPKPKPNEDPGLISELQVKMVWAIVTRRGLSEQDLYNAVGALGYEHLRELPRSKVNQLLDSIQEPRQ